MKTTTTKQVATGWQRIEDQDGRAQYLPVKTPQRRPPALQGEILPPMHQEARPPVQTLQTVTTSHEDRAKGFTMTTVPLAAVVGLVALLAALLGCLACPGCHGLRC
jgi:hypothetical protein